MKSNIFTLHPSSFTVKMLEFFCPDMYVKSVTHIDLDDLKERGFCHIMIDLDNTLLPWGEDNFAPDVIDWLEKAFFESFKICIVSNASKKRVSSLAEKLALPFIYYAGKPRKGCFFNALNLMNGHIESAVVIGDQIFTDIFGGKRTGIFTILVRPVKKRELLTTRIMRNFEKMTVYLLKKKKIFPESQ